MRKFPLIPTEQEIDVLISGSSKYLSTFLQHLKETAMRSGEARRIQWINNIEKQPVRRGPIKEVLEAIKLPLFRSCEMGLDEVFEAGVPY